MLPINQRKNHNPLPPHSPHIWQQEGPGMRRLTNTVQRLQQVLPSGKDGFGGGAASNLGVATIFVVIVVWVEVSTCTPAQHLTY